MATPSLSLSERARQGDIEAIAALMNRPLQPKGITADVASQSDQLQIRLEADGTPNRSVLKQFAYRGLSNLGIASINRVKLYGYRRGEQDPVWEDEFDLPPFLSSTESPVVERSAIPATQVQPTNEVIPTTSTRPQFEQSQSEQSQFDQSQFEQAQVDNRSSDGLEFLNSPSPRLEPIDDTLPRRDASMSYSRPLDEPVARSMTDDDISLREPEDMIRQTEEQSVVLGEDAIAENSSSNSSPLRLLLIAAAALLLGLTTVLAGIFAYRTLFDTPRGQVADGTTPAPNGTTPAPDLASPLPPPTATPPVAVAPASPGITPVATPTPAPLSTIPTGTAPQPPTAPAITNNPYASAETRAAEAETLSRTAASAQQWQQIAALWQESATLMARIPASDANYQTAQDRVAQYLSNRDYARQRAASAP